MSKKQIDIVEKALQEFLEKKELSTIKGVKTRIKRLKKGIEREFDVDEEVAEEIYSYWDNENFKYLSKYSPKPSASDFAEMIQEAKKENWTLEKFENQVKGIVNYSNDSWLRNKVIGVYNDLV